MAVPQCRFCLRRVSENNLLMIVAKHRKRALAELQMQSFNLKAYPYACFNCLNMLDLMVAFKKSVTKTSELLDRGKMHLESDGWDDKIFIEAFAKCRNAVEQHARQIDRVYEEFCEGDTKADEDNGEEFADADESKQSTSYDEVKEEIIQEEIIQFDAVEVSEDWPVDSDCDEFLKQERQESEDEEPNTAAAAEVKPKRKKKRNETKRLCDLCGETVCVQSTETHRNRHLGIKPYICSFEGCGMAFHSRFSRTMHFRRNHKPKGLALRECGICGKMVKHLDKHQVVHRPEKNYVCTLCEKAFKTLKHLRQHSVVHSRSD